MKTKLIIGKNYYFDLAMDDYGTLIAIEGDVLVFKPIEIGSYVGCTDGDGYLRFYEGVDCYSLAKNQTTAEPETEEQLHEATKKEVLAYLKTGKAITKLEIIDKFRYINGGDLIFNLRKEGYNIETTMITNGKKRFASYKLIEK